MEKVKEPTQNTDNGTSPAPLDIPLTPVQMLQIQLAQQLIENAQLLLENRRLQFETLARSLTGPYAGTYELDVQGACLRQVSDGQA